MKLSILTLTSLRHLIRHPWQFALAILGVALGVAVVVAIDLANQSARVAFSLSTETIAGRATHQIVGGPSGLPDDLYRRLRVDLGVRNSAPVIEGYVTTPRYPGLTLRVLGIDPLAEGQFRPYTTGGAGGQGSPTSFFTEPGAALLAGQTAKQYGIGGAVLRQPVDLALEIGGRAASTRVVGLIEPEDEASRRALDALLVTDVATAQEWFGKVGRLDRIDLILPLGAAGDAQIAAIKSILPPGAQITTPQVRSNALQQMTSAFELNLSALSLLALVVGMFLIYNTMTFSVVQRRGLLGTLRCLGVSRAEVLRLVLGEALLVGLVGSLAGIALGIVLGRGLVGLVTQTINDLYFAVSVSGLAISPLPIIKGFALGMGATALAAAVPALEATLTPPRTVIRRSSYEERVLAGVPLVALGGLAAMALGAVAMALPGNNLVLSFGGLFAITIGAAALTPIVTLWLMTAVRPLAGRLFGMLGRMAARDVVASLSRTSVAVAALMIAVSVTIGVGLMVSSFRVTVVSWLEQTIRADIFVSAPSTAANRLDTPVPDAFVASAAVAPGVERVRRYRSVDVTDDTGQYIRIALDVAMADHQVFQWVGAPAGDVWAQFDGGTGVLVSEPMAFKRNLAVGDTIALVTDRGERKVKVAGVFLDYGSDQGVLMLPLDRYRAWWDDAAITSLGIYLRPGFDVEQTVVQLRTLVPSGQIINIQSNRTLREASLAIFDRTFAITNVLQLLATIVSFVGILAALMALQLERSRELGVLRANGLTPRQLWGLVLGQTGLMGLAAGLLAIPVGTMMAAVLVYVINKRSFGWTLLFRPDAGLYGQALLLAVVAALLAGLYPAWRMGQTSPALALREE